MELSKIWRPISFFAKLYVEKVDKDRTSILKSKYTKLLHNKLSVDEIKYEELIEVNADRVDELFEIFTNEEEAIKLNIYKRIYKAARNASINKKDYSKFMRITKNLPTEALNLLPKIYVYIKNKGKTKIPLGNFLNSIENNEPYLCNSLMNEALLNKEPCCGGYNVIETKLVIEVTEQFFPKENLTINTQKIDVWKNYDVLILGDCVFGESEGAQEIKEILNQESVPHDSQAINAIGEGYTHLILIIDQIQDIDEYINEIKNLQTDSKIIKVASTIQKTANDNILILSNKEDIQKLRSEFSE